MNPHIELTQKYTNFYFGCTKKGCILKWWCLLWLTQTISHSAWESWWCGSLARAQPALELHLPYFRAHKPPPPMLGFILSFRVNENVEALGGPCKSVSLSAMKFCLLFLLLSSKMLCWLFFGPEPTGEPRRQMLWFWVKVKGLVEPTWFN